MINIPTISKIALVGVIAVALSGCASFINSVENKVIGEGSGSGKIVSKGKANFEADDFDRVEISTDAMEIYVSRSSSDRAEIELLVDDEIKNKFKLNTSIKSKTLNIDVNEKTKKINFGVKGQKGERRLEVSLPDKLYKRVTIHNDFGLIEAGDLDADKLDIRIDAGSISLDNVHGEMKLVSDVGEIVAEGFQLKHDLTAKTDTGEITIRLIESPKNAKINLQSDLGDVSADLDDIDYSVNRGKEKVGKIGSGGPRIDAEVSVGSITVEVE